MTKNVKGGATPAPEQPEILTADTIELGRWVKDLVSGFQGVVTTINVHMSGMTQVSVQPQVKEGATEYPDGINIDIENIVYADPPEGWIQPRSRPVVVEFDDLEFQLGHKVKDVVAKIEGIATMYMIMINGCLYIGIDPPQDKPKALVQRAHHYADWQRVKFVDEGLKRKLEKKMEKIYAENPTATKGPGGPVSKTFRPG